MSAARANIKEQIPLRQPLAGRENSYILPFLA
jgi:hypothetical protein